MTKPQLSKDHLLLIKSMEEPTALTDPWPTIGTDDCFIPPLGSVNRDGLPTSELDSSACESDVDFIKSKAFLPAFEILFAHNTVSFKVEPDKIDRQDTSRPKRYSRGHDTYLGSMSWDKEEESDRIYQAMAGKWLPAKLGVEPGKHYREFCLWALRDPDIMSLGATKCKELVKNFYVIFDSIEVTDEGQVKMSTPISRVWFRKFYNVTFPTDAQLVHTEVAGSGEITPVDAQPREFSRLNLKITEVTGTGTVTIVGQNVVKEPTSETFTAEVASVLGRLWFDTIDKIVVSPGISSISFELYDYDYAIINPALK